MVVLTKLITDKMLVRNKMANRKEHLLSLLRESGNQVNGRTRLMKLAFLVDRTLDKKGEPSPYSFHAYKHGPFDKEVLSAAESLEDQGLLEEDTEVTPYGEMSVYKLTEEGIQKAEKVNKELGRWDKKAVNGTINRWGDTGTQTMIGYVYDNYPDYTPD